MNCRRARTLLIPFLEAELSDKLEVALKAHLEICTACNKEKELLSESWRLMDSYVTPKLKEDFTPSLMRKLRSEQATTVKVAYRLPQFAFRRLVPVLAILFIVLSIVFWKKGFDTEWSAIRTPPIRQETANVVSDEEIIRDLDLYENAELLDSLYLLTELDVIEKLDDSTIIQ